MDVIYVSSLRRFSPIILQKFVLTCCEEEFTFSVFFFYLDFISWIFAIHRAAGEEGDCFFNSSPPLPLVFGHLDISWVIAAESLPLRMVGSCNHSENIWDWLWFSCEVAHYGKNLISAFEEFFANIKKICVLAGALGTKLWSCGV